MTTTPVSVSAPKKAAAGAGEKLAWLEAMKLLKHPFVLVLWLVFAAVIGGLYAWNKYV